MNAMRVAQVLSWPPPAEDERQVLNDQPPSRTHGTGSHSDLLHELPGKPQAGGPTHVSPSVGFVDRRSRFPARLDEDGDLALQKTAV